MNLTGCTFDPDAHVYRIRCRPVPHVTGILRDVVPGWQADPWYLSRGRTVHACVALLAAGKSYDLDLSAQSETDRKAIEGKIAAGRKFMADLRPQWHHVELPVFSAA